MIVVTVISHTPAGISGHVIQIPVDALAGPERSDQVEELIRCYIASLVRLDRWQQIGDGRMVELEGYEQKALLTSLNEATQVQRLGSVPATV